MNFAKYLIAISLTIFFTVLIVIALGESRTKRPGTEWSNYQPSPGILCVYNKYAQQPYCIERMYRINIPDNKGTEK